MEELVALFVNNGSSVACLLYFMWMNKTQVSQTNELLGKIATFMELIEKEIGTLERRQSNQPVEYERRS